MKIIFLDIDGVLNSLSFYEKSRKGQEHLDPFSLTLLKALVNASGARLVLTSSWREGWNRNEEECQEEGKILNRAFEQVGLSIWDKTGRSLRQPARTRCLEILSWLKNVKEPVDSFVILDDGDYAWAEYGLDRFLVRTDFNDGGLKPCHIVEGLAILQDPPKSVKALLRSCRKKHFIQMLRGEYR